MLRRFVILGVLGAAVGTKLVNTLGPRRQCPTSRGDSQAEAKPHSTYRIHKAAIGVHETRDSRIGRASMTRWAAFKVLSGGGVARAARAMQGVLSTQWPNGSVKRCKNPRHLGPLT